MAVIAFPNPTNTSAAYPGFPSGGKAITKSDADTFERPVTVYVGGAGDVAVMPANGAAAVTFKGLLAGSIVPCQVIAVLSTGTTATDMVAVF